MTIPTHPEILQASQHLLTHYQQKYPEVSGTYFEDESWCSGFRLHAPGFRENNGPLFLHHNRPVTNVMILIHGLSDSPYYMKSIATFLYRKGFNVVLPLLSGHGLKEPNLAMKDDHLAEHWTADVDAAIHVARMLGQQISMGGLSTGATLSVNAALRQPDLINGGLLLFSAALDIGLRNEWLGKTLAWIHSGTQALREMLPSIEIPDTGTAINPLTQLVRNPMAKWLGKTDIPLEQLGLFARNMMKWVDGGYAGQGPNPYKYPTVSYHGSWQLIRLLMENERLARNTKLIQPVFAAHSIADQTALLKGVIRLFSKLNGPSYLFLIEETPPVPHSCIVLEKSIRLHSEILPAMPEPTANPRFTDMMESAYGFFKACGIIPVNLAH
ncbi:MAG: alpha/beta hydrolase [SAR324 cluster bacterium]|nr:alpha/beta hydrolase [SAR324 cluster bacterium]